MIFSLIFFAVVVPFLYKVYRLLFPGSVDWNSSQNGGKLVADVLESHGIKYMFTLVGGHISPILVESEKRGVRVIDCRHEVTAVFAADAVARLTGVPGVAAVTAGPGLTNTITAVKNAQMAESPLVLIGGAAATLLKGRGALQDIDQISLFKSICKWTATVNRVADIPHVMRTAFQKCQQGTPGPVFVEFPIDTLYPIKDVAKAYGVELNNAPSEEGQRASKAKGFVAQLIQWYLNQHVKMLFGDAFVPHQLSPLPFNFPMHTEDQLGQVVQLVKEADKPLILLGSQATLPPTKPQELKAALESLGIPCYLGGMARGMLGQNGPLHIRQQRKNALKEADLIMAGMVADFRLDYGRTLSKRAKIVAINRDKSQLNKNQGMFWRATVSVLGDPSCFVVELARKLKDFKPIASRREAWIATLQERDKQHEKNIEKTANQEMDEKRINPLKLLQKVDECLDEDCIMVADGGDFVGSAAYILRPRGPLQWLDPGAFGTLGVGGGFALGAKLVHPDKQVVIIYGDGSSAYSLAEYDTFARHNLPVLSIVGNDACWSQIAREQVPMFNSSVACDLAYTDYDVVAEGYGGCGFRLSEISEADGVLRQAAAAAKGDNARPALVNAIIGKTNFREGSISV